MSKPNLEALARSWLEEMQAIETMLFDIYRIRSIDTAVSLQLDRIGAIVGQVRGSLSDADYRVWIRARIFLNGCSGTPDEMLEMVDRLTGVLAELTEYDPAAFILDWTSVAATLPTALAEMLTQIKPAGVRGELMWSDTTPANQLILGDSSITSDSLTGLSDTSVSGTGGSLVGLVQL